MARGRHQAPKHDVRSLASLFLTATLAALVSCESNGDVLLPSTKGGDGTVIRIPVDGGRDASPGGSTMLAGGHGGHQTSGAGGSVATGGATAGGAGTVGAGTGGAIAAGGASGVGGHVVDDPCTACEKAKCSHPMNGSDLLLAAYEVCFIGTGVPAAALGPVCPTDPSSTALTAANGPMAGTAKTNLCQALLKCVHQTNCTGGIDVDNQTACYCGTDAGGAAISLNTCESPTFVPTGACVQQVAAALEVSQFSVSAAGFSDPCLANGAAFVLYDFCDANCCEQECGMAASGYEDPTYCNVPGSGGAGSGGSSATGGSTGSGGKGGSGGPAGASGSGGTTATGGVLGSGGSTGGSPATGGSPGTGGSLQLQNVQFDSDTAGWTASFGATITRSAMDAANKSQSGSLDLHLGAADATLSVEAAAWQCVSTTGGATFSLSASILVPAGSSSAGALGLWFYASNDCSGPIAGSASTPSSATNAWQKVTSSAQAPSGAHSMAVRLEVIKPLGQTAAEALFDAVSVSGP